MEALEDESELGQSDPAQGVVVEIAHLHPVQEVISGRGAVEAAQDVEHRALSRTAGTHDRPKAAPLEMPVHSVEGPHLLPSDRIGFAHRAEGNDRIDGRRWDHCRRTFNGWRGHPVAAIPLNGFRGAMEG